MVNKLLKNHVVALFFVLCGAATPPFAAEVREQGTFLKAQGDGVVLSLAFSEKAPFSVYTLDNPRRLLVDLGETSLANMPGGLAAGLPQVSALRYGLFQLGQSRIVLDLNAPLVVKSEVASVTAGGGVQLRIELSPTTPEAFAAASAPQQGAVWRTDQQAPRVEGEVGLPIIAIDPGHGGTDFGAQQDGVNEKDIVLQIGRTLRDLMIEDGRFRVLLTRDDDTFIPLGARVELARRAGARAFISLHADVVTRGHARGTTVFSLSEAGESQQALTIATLENRSDLVAGISVEGEDDQLTEVLLQLAHRETDALSDRFADTMAEALWFQNDMGIKSRRMAAGFRVLRAPDIPSVLVEMGFMSDETDLENLQDPDWQLAMAEKLRDGLGHWLEVEDEMRGLLRN